MQEYEYHLISASTVFFRKKNILIKYISNIDLVLTINDNSALFPLVLVLVSQKIISTI